MPLEFLGKTEAWILLAARIKMFLRGAEKEEKRRRSPWSFQLFSMCSVTRIATDLNYFGFDVALHFGGEWRDSHIGPRPQSAVGAKPRPAA